MVIFEKMQNYYDMDDTDDMFRPFANLPHADRTSLAAIYTDAIKKLCPNVDLMESPISKEYVRGMSMYILTASDDPKLQETVDISSSSIDPYARTMRAVYQSGIKTVAVFLDVASYTIRYIEPFVTDKHRILDVAIDMGYREHMHGEEYHTLTFTDYDMKTGNIQVGDEKYNVSMLFYDHNKPSSLKNIHVNQVVVDHSQASNTNSPN